MADVCIDLEIEEENIVKEYLINCLLLVRSDIELRKKGKANVEILHFWFEINRIDRHRE